MVTSEINLRSCIEKVQIETILTANEYNDKVPVGVVEGG